MALKPTGKVPKDLQTLFRSGRIGDLSDGALLERFLTAHDEAAFESLVGRHAPMVLRVCLATLADPADVDDAFQAVFAILFRQGAAIRSRASVASWLHGVALRVAARANVDAARRRKHERKAAWRTSMTATEPADDPDRAARALREEVARLPDRYREAVVLYYFESQTCDEAARRIGRPVGTLKARLAQARGLLKKRLTRRGIALPAVLFAAGAEATAAPPVRPEVANATLRSIATRDEIPTRVSLLAQGVIGSMQLQTIKLIGACCLLVALGVGAVMAVRGARTPRDEPRGTARDKTSTEKPPVVASRPPQYDMARLALDQTLPAATKAADPYMLTFALIALAKAQNAAGDRDSALRTFVEANRVAGTVANEHLRRLAVMRTAVARGQIGDSAPARATLERFVREGAGLGPEARYNLMSMVIGFLHQAGFKDDARATLDKELAAVRAIADEGLRDGGVYRLLGTQLTLGDFVGALGQAARYAGQRSSDRAALLQDIMRYNSATGARPPAARCLARPRTVPRDHLPVPARRPRRTSPRPWPARATSPAGWPSCARSATTSTNHFKSSARPSSRAPWSKSPAKRPKPVPATRRSRRSARRDRPRFSGPKRTACPPSESVRSPRPRSKSTISPGRRSQRPRSRPMASRKPWRWLPSRGARRRPAIGRPQPPRSGRPTPVPRPFAPRADLMGDNPAANVYRVLREIALAEAETGDVKAALLTVAGHGNNVWRSPVLAGIAQIQAKKGDAAGALFHRPIDPRRLARRRGIPLDCRAPSSIGRCLGRAGLGHPARGSRSQGLRAHRHHRRARRNEAGEPGAENTQTVTSPRDREPGHANAALRMLRRCF